MDSTLQKFVYDGLIIRTTQKDGKLWFAASDVCNVLQIKNNRDAVMRLDHDEKAVVSTDTPGGKQNLVSINESGLYSLILSSRKPEARDFKRWVTNEVLPYIRKKGQYSITPPKDNDPLLLDVETEARKMKAIQMKVNYVADIFKLENIPKMLYALEEFQRNKLDVPHIQALEATKDNVYLSWIDIYKLYPNLQKSYIKKTVYDKCKRKEFWYSRGGSSGTFYKYLKKDVLNFLN